MSMRYRLIVWKDFRLWCKVETHGPMAKDVVRDMMALLSAQAGYSIEIQVSHEENRILETGPHGTRLLAIEPIFTTVDINSLEIN